MRIIHVVLGYYPSQIWGGVPPVVDTLCRSLQANGHVVSVIATNILDYQSRIRPDSGWGEWNGVPVLYLRSHWKGRRNNSMGFIYSPDIWHYRDIIRGADIIHIHGYRTFMFLAVALLALQYRVPFLVQPHGSLPAMLGRVRLKQVFDTTIGPYLLQRAAKNVALADSETKQLTQYGVQPERIARIFNPFDPSICPDLPDGTRFRNLYGISENDKIVLFLSRLHEKKGLDLLIRAFALIERNDVYLCVIGPDDGFETIARNMVSELGIQTRVKFIGPLYDEEKFEAYRAADVYVLPTRGVEGLPMTLLEALYTATPIVVTRNTDIAELVDGRAGIAVNYDFVELKNALDQLLSNPRLTQTYSDQAPLLLHEHFETSVIISELEKIYSECLAVYN